MKLQVKRYTIVIIPETEQDVAFLEDTLGIEEDGEFLKFERVNFHKSSKTEFRLESFIPYGGVVEETENCHDTSTTGNINLYDVKCFDITVHDYEDEAPSITLVNIEEIE